MPLVNTPFLGGAYTSRSPVLAANRCINLYAELVETRDGKEIGGFYGTPGLVELGTFGPGPIRGLRTIAGTLYAVSGGKVYRINSGLSGAVVGTLATVSGPVGMVDNGIQILFVDGQQAYGYDTHLGTFQTIILPFSGNNPVVAAYQDGFFLLNESTTQSWWQSDLNDVFTWNGLSFSSADGQPDPIVAMVDNHREVWLLGANTTEVWINAGNPQFAFQRLNGVFLQQGCVAPYSACVCGESVVWLGRDTHGECVTYQARGYQPIRISTHAVERAMQSYAHPETAIGYAYQQEGHLFYVLTFPDDDATWCYDTSTGLWHERLSFALGIYHRHRGNCYAAWRGWNVVGDFEDGRIYYFDLGAYTDAGAVLKRLRSWPAQGPGKITLKSVRFNSLELLSEGGVGNALPPGENPQVMMRWSDTGGLSFGNEHWSQLGRIGEVKNRTIWRRMGSGRDRVFEVSMTDPVKAAWIGALLEAEVGIS